MAFVLEHFQLQVCWRELCLHSPIQKSTTKPCLQCILDGKQISAAMVAKGMLSLCSLHSSCKRVQNFLTSVLLICWFWGTFESAPQFSLHQSQTFPEHPGLFPHTFPSLHLALNLLTFDSARGQLFSHWHHKRLSRAAHTHKGTRKHFCFPKPFNISHLRNLSGGKGLFLGSFPRSSRTTPA